MLSSCKLYSAWPLLEFQKGLLYELVCTVSGTKIKTSVLTFLKAYTCLQQPFAYGICLFDTKISYSTPPPWNRLGQAINPENMAIRQSHF